MGNEKNRLQQIGVLVTIPFVLAVPPLLGWALGHWLDKHLNTDPYLMYLFLALGIGAGVRECYRIIKQFGQ